MSGEDRPALKTTSQSYRSYLYSLTLHDCYSCPI